MSHLVSSNSYSVSYSVSWDFLRLSFENFVCFFVGLKLILSGYDSLKALSSPVRLDSTSSVISEVSESDSYLGSSSS